MGKVVEGKGKKKKGRPSLLDLQKRNLKQHQQQQNQNEKTIPDHKKSNLSSSPNNYKNATPSPFRRSTRRSNPIIEAEDDEEEEDDEGAEGTGRRKKREKKLELVLKLQNDEVSNSEGEDDEDDEDVEKSHKKRKINAIPDGSGSIDKKEEKPTVANNTGEETVDEDGTATPLPDKKLLEFVLDRLQKKDTYGVFSEPVDPDELPDYHEIIDNPMDFGTVRQNLADGAYSSLEQFERDIFLICSNAMEYNAPDTVYFRQARSIHELAKKNFENLRQDSDGNEAEPKVVRRGRPPKYLKKTVVRTSLEPSSDLPNGKTPPAAGETSTWSNYDLRRGIVLEKSGPPESAGRSFHGSHNSESYTGLSTEHKFERNDEFTGSRGKLYKYGKKQPALDEERRNTYLQLHLSAGVREPSVLATFDGEKKMLLPVGLHSEHGYARSLVRFAATLGPVGWKIASRKIEKSLPSGLMFGPGWVGEKEAETKRPVLLTSDPCSHPLRSQYISPFESPSTVNSEIDNLSDKMKGDVASDNKLEFPPSPWSSDSRLKRFASPSMTNTSTPASVRCSEPTAECAETVNAPDNNVRYNVLDSSNGVMGPRTPLQIQQGSSIHPGMNGINGAIGYDLQSQSSKLAGAIRPTSFNLHSPRMHSTVPRTNNNISGNCFKSGDPEHFANSTSQGLSQHSKQAAVPPDLNVRFQTPGSPSSTRVDSTQPDLALQL